MKTSLGITKRISPMALVIMVAMMAISCTGSKQLTYFRDLPDSTVVHLPPAEKQERIIENGDRLDIQITARDEEVAKFFTRNSGNNSSTSSSGSSNSTALATYQVDPAGLLEFPIIGKVKAAGLTAQQFKDSLTHWVTPYLKDPLVDVKFTSFRVTVLGEVRTPGTFNLNMESTTLFDALAAAGDLPHTARRYNVQLYRDYNGSRTITKFDLRKKSVLNDPQVFQIKPNDVLYVETRPGSIFKDDFSFFSSVFTLLVGIVTLWVTVTK